MGWSADFKRDIQRYGGRVHAGGSIGVFLRNQGLWASLQYRVAREIDRSNMPRSLKRPLSLGLGVWQKAVEITTGISLPKTAEIGGGLYMPHGGRVVVSSVAHLGEGCTLAHGATVGVNRKGGEFDAPMIGNHVFVGINAVVIGPIKVGDFATIGACTVVSRDVPEGAMVRPAPSRLTVRQ